MCSAAAGAGRSALEFSKANEKVRKAKWLKEREKGTRESIAQYHPLEVLVVL